MLRSEFTAACVTVAASARRSVCSGCAWPDADAVGATVPCHDLHHHVELIVLRPPLLPWPHRTENLEADLGQSPYRGVTFPGLIDDPRCTAALGSRRCRRAGPCSQSQIGRDLLTSTASRPGLLRTQQIPHSCVTGRIAAGRTGAPMTSPVPYGEPRVLVTPLSPFDGRRTRFAVHCSAAARLLRRVLDVRGVAADSCPADRYRRCRCVRPVLRIP